VAAVAGASSMLTNDGRTGSSAEMVDCRDCVLTLRDLTLPIRRIPAVPHTLVSNTHRRRRRTATVELRRVGVGAVNTINSQLAHDDCRPTDSVDNLETGQTDSIASDYINFDRY